MITVIFCNIYCFKLRRCLIDAQLIEPESKSIISNNHVFVLSEQICKRIQEGGWTVVQDSEEAMGPYAYKGNQWTSFDDVSVVRRKAEMVRSMKLGGAMVWALDLDDFKNRCGCEHHPLLRTINRVLREYPVADPGCNLASI